MKRVSTTEIKRFIDIYRKSRSLREISRQTGRSPNTIKKYLNKKIELKLQNNIVKVKTQDDLLVGTYVGLWMGDGTQYYDDSYVVKFCSNKKQKDLNEFISNIIIRLFDKKPWLINDKDTNRAYIKLKSKFIYYFIYEYCSFDKNKTLTVNLKNNIESYPEDFLRGVILGLSLSDGYLKKRFCFNSISKNLSLNAYSILLQMGYNPYIYVHIRSKWKWHDLHMISLRTEESKTLLVELNDILQKLGSNKSFQELKYGPTVTFNPHHVESFERSEYV